ncbi:glutathione S-transferase family protein [Bacterioplanoides sp. SCSIO 12839]|uniref:glutathione S-transferase family protein n=1 Tax=Bacterioplanoides sp. SCSIO 12839 TaxID=2829569 RepID=UPI0021048F6C|nr:glutathione S-transferase family protein [Bacterioplanoides sp. SCSIO 12839]UTW49249.1 glutathione S-transferase [Bacterioplanoides sp. SCSIO 12839]
MKLLFTSTSPYARLVRIVCREKGLASRVEEQLVDVWNDDPELLSANPVGRVPALITDSGVAISESILIAQYLNQLTATPDLSVATDVDWQLFGLAIGLMDRSFNTVIHEKFDGTDVRESALGKRRWAAIKQTLAVFNENLTQPVEVLSLADIAIAVALDYLDFRLPELAVNDRFEQLAQWRQWTESRQSFIATAFA